MDILLIILAGLFVLTGFLGCVLPILPGTPLSYAGILLLHFSSQVDFSTRFLLFWAAMVVLVQVLDYLIPLWGARCFGGSKAGVWGSAVGMVVGLFLGPWGIILCPFAGAVAGELLSGKQTRQALRAGFGAFIGFLLGSSAKLVVAGFLIFYYVDALLCS